MHKEKKTNEYPIEKYWALKIIVDLDPTQVSYSDFSYSELYFLGLSKFKKDLDEYGGCEKKIKQEIIRQIDIIEKRKPGTNQVLQKNLKKLVKILKLNDTEETILTFAVVSQYCSLFNDILQKLDNLKRQQMLERLSVALNIKIKKVKKALRPDGLLFKSGLLKIEHNNLFGDSYLSLSLMDGLIERLYIDGIKIDEIFSTYFYPASVGQLNIKDFDHLSTQIDILNRILNNFKINPVKGINILLYGPPGTGKSELVRAIALNNSFNLHEIAICDEHGAPLLGDARFSAFSLAQHILRRNKRNLVVFDEIEDVFPKNLMTIFGFTGDNKGKKAWINNLLENNPVPAIWISNSVEQIDEAYKRRFKYVLKLDIPPMEKRLKIIKESVGQFPVSPAWLEGLAMNTDISPALVSQAAELASLINGDCKIDNTNKKLRSACIESDLTQILNNSLEVMDKKLVTNIKLNDSIHYNINFLNPDYDLKTLVSGLAQHQQGRICLYGPPGTGKTAFAHHLSLKINKRILVKRASDLLSKWVGESETNIAEMFKESERENAILLLDEADSFLMNRTNAQHSWQITQVNELLTQMENYEGIFICSTNLIDNFDRASIRRFDLKIKLDYLLPDQVWSLFKQILKNKGIKLKDKSFLKQELNSLNNLTPGDFSTVVRQNRLSNFKLEPTQLVTALKKESQFKMSKTRGIGFTANI